MTRKMRSDKQKKHLTKRRATAVKKRPVSNQREKDRKFVYVCMYVCTDVCLTDAFHTVKKRNNNNMSTTKTRKRRKKKKGQQIKLAIPNVQKNMSTSLERKRKKDRVFVLLEGEQVRRLALIVVIDVVKQIFCEKDKK